MLMVNLPLLRSLDVTGYGLYPGGTGEPGLHARFKPGLTLVLGANGLGKTTLVTMLYRLLTGPYDFRAFAQGGDLGTASREVVPLRGSPRQTFAHRVADGAVQARARLTFDVGGVEVSVERSLRDLTLLGFNVGGDPLDQDEELYQAAMVSLANVSTFSDWILLLRFIVFYLEDRRALVWDPTAQRQVLRVLFLDPQHSKDWEERERKILAEDSRVRNMQSVRSNLMKRISHVESLTVDAPRVKKELEERDRDQQEAQESLERETSALPAVDDNYERARHRVLILEQDRESRYRELEHARLLAVSARLPQHSDSARYILTQILTEEHCLVCGTSVPEVSRSMESRIEDDKCVVCGSKLPEGSAETPIHLADARMRREEQDFHRIESDLEAASFALEKSEGERREVVTAIQGLRVRIADNSARIEQTSATPASGGS
ncbi:MAG: AAA family ATPase [Chloroflexota bacterium]|nr:AAA family ATPase [Chloroflexota bacterium]MDE2886080.1 AAA family ATPase [Chloroflexota bacterium]